MADRVTWLLGGLLSCLLTVAGEAAGADTFSSLSSQGAQDKVGVPGFPELYQSVRLRQCNTANTCIAIFDKVPAGRLLKATQINCTGSIQDGTSTLGDFLLFFEDFSVDSLRNDLLANPLNTGRYEINEGIQSFFPAGARPKMRFSGNLAEGKNMSIFCNLSGELLRP